MLLRTALACGEEITPRKLPRPRWLRVGRLFHQRQRTLHDQKAADQRHPLKTPHRPDLWLLLWLSDVFVFTVCCWMGVAFFACDPTSSGACLSTCCVCFFMRILWLFDGWLFGRPVSALPEWMVQKSSHVFSTWSKAKKETVTKVQEPELRK